MKWTNTVRSRHKNTGQNIHLNNLWDIQPALLPSVFLPFSVCLLLFSSAPPYNKQYQWYVLSCKLNLQVTRCIILGQLQRYYIRRSGAQSTAHWHIFQPYSQTCGLTTSAIFVNFQSNATTFQWQRQGTLISGTCIPCLLRSTSEKASNTTLLWCFKKHHLGGHIETIRNSAQREKNNKVTDCFL